METLAPENIAAEEVLLFSGARVLAPEDLGVRDVLVAGGRILAVLAPDEVVRLGDLNVKRIPAEGLLLTPALVDIHSHLVGGGGWGGPATQCDPIDPSELIRAGIGSVVGLLGYDTTARRPEGLLGRVRKFRSLGFNAYMMVGEIAWPPVTITGDISRDLALIPEVRGVKSAIADHDAGIFTVDRLADLVGQVLRGSRTAGKPPVLHLHVGRSEQRFEVISQAIERDLIEPGIITLTHVNWSQEMAREAAELAKAGVNVDLTSCIRPDYYPGSIGPVEGFYELVSAGAPIERITVSSDAGGSHFDSTSGTTIWHPPALLFDAFARLIGDRETKWADAVSVFTSVPADRMGLVDTGRIEPGCRADLLVFEPDTGKGEFYLDGVRAGEVGA